MRHIGLMRPLREVRMRTLITSVASLVLAGCGANVQEPSADCPDAVRQGGQVYVWSGVTSHHGVELGMADLAGCADDGNGEQGPV